MILDNICIFWFINQNVTLNYIIQEHNKRQKITSRKSVIVKLFGYNILMSNSYEIVKAKEEPPTLREEKHYKHFYPDLDEKDAIPLFEKRMSNKDDIPVNDVPLKQIILNDKIKIERLEFQPIDSCYKCCKIIISQLNDNYRVSKPYWKFGYRPVIRQIYVDLRSVPYFKRTDQLLDNSNEFLVYISKYLRNFKVEYDMDEQDDLYLNFLNRNRLSNQSKLLNHEIFEIIMTVLEIEWFHLEKKIPQRISKGSQLNICDSKGVRNYYELYGSDDGTEFTSDQPCAICTGTECDNSNAIVFCDGCNIAVHQECYGVVFIPEGQWLCRRCMISKNGKINCLFCPSHTGAFKQIDNGAWSHVICGIWIPELSFANLHYMEPIEGIEFIPKSRWRLNCYICRQKMGSCIQCSNKNCFIAYHVTCAKRAGLYMSFSGCTILEAASNNFLPGSKLESFCGKHSPSGWGECEKGIKQTRQYFEDNVQSGINTNKIKKLDNSGNKWKTNRGTPIAPQYFADIIDKILDMFKIENSGLLSLDFCKYWSMKRELKRGASLVKKVDYSSFSTLKFEEMEQRVKFSGLLLRDLNKLEKLACLLTERQKANKLLYEANDTINRLGIHPVKYIIKKEVLDKLSKRESFKLLLKETANLEGPNLHTIINSCNEDIYQSILDFKIDMISFGTRITGNSNISQILVTNFQRDFDKLISKIDKIDIKKLLNNDFIIKENTVEGLRWNTRSRMKDADLSDIESEFTQSDENLLKSLLE